MGFRGLIIAGGLIAAIAMPASGTDPLPPVASRLILPRPLADGPEPGRRAPLPPELAALQARVAEAARSGSARVGLAAIDLTSGAMISVNGADRFPMASTVKIAIAAAFLRAVQEGRLGLERDYALTPDQRRFAAHLGDMKLYRNAMSGAQLIELMMIRSDNSAADILLHAVGGTRVIERFLTSAGVQGQRVDRSIAELLDDRQTTKTVKVGKGRRRHSITVRVPRAATPGDRRDSSTPEAMAALLAKLRGGEILDARHTAYLFDVMARCRTGAGRIRGLLPAGTPVAHKTGTLNGVTDDVGIVTLPNGHHLAVAIFETGSGGHGGRDRNIARLARLLYDGFGGSLGYAAADGEGIASAR